LGAIYWNEGKLDEAEESINKALEVSSKHRGGEPDALIVINLARIQMDKGELEGGLAMTERAIRTSKRLNDSFSLSLCLDLVSRYHYLKGEWQAALSLNREALHKSHAGDFTFWTQHAVRAQALILIELGQMETAVTFLSATSELSAMHRTLEELEVHSATSRCRELLGEERFHNAWSKGLAMPLNEIYKLAIG
jgi:ATP/maltotriose-dependent transcriptional regulator MalT